MDDAPQQATLRDTISDAFDTVIADGGAEAPAAPSAAPVAESAPAQPAKAEGQPRREDGTFAPKGKDSPAAPAAAAQPKATSAPAPQAGAAGEPKRRPSAWKKELEAHWPALAPEVQAEILRREDDYAKGVSTYKQEWDRARPVLDALGPFMPDLERHRIPPAQFIANLGAAHRTLALGSPQEKLAMFSRLAQEYQVPLQQLFVQGHDGQIYLQPQAAPQPQGLTEDRVAQLVQERLAEQSTTQEVSQFQAAKDDAGNPRYPHFESVRETMAALLQAGLAQDLAGAYDAALRHPRHAEIFDELQRQQREASEKAAAEERARQAGAARRKAISPTSATPTASAVAAAGGKKGLRAQLEENFDAVAAQRV